MQEAVTPLPDDVTTLQALIREQAATIAQQQRELEQVRHRLDHLLRRLFGPRSEKLRPDQLLLFDPPAAETPPPPPTPAPEEPVRTANKKKGHGRRPLPANLPRVRTVCDVPAAERVCATCQGACVCIGEDVSEQLDYQPASLFVTQRVRPKYACPKCRTSVLAAALPAQPIDKGLPGPGLLAHIIVSKFADHLPTYRQEAMLARHGVELHRSTLCSWLAACAELLTPLYVLMCQQMRQSKVIHTDDTPVTTLDRDDPDGRKTGRVWVYLGDAAHPFTVYDFRPDRARDGPVNFLKGFTGYLQADAYAGYHDLYAQGAREVACWAHARRYFFEAKTSDPAPAHAALAFIRRLYDVEDQLHKPVVEADGQKRPRTAEERQQIRQADARPVLQSFRAWLDDQKVSALPKSPFGQAVQYALNNWDALQRYTTDGDLAIDNNLSERAVRGIAVGRKGWLFFGSDQGGRTAAIHLSLIETCKRHHVEPFTYLRDVLTRLPNHPADQLDALLPNRWTATTSPAPH